MRAYARGGGGFVMLNPLSPSLTVTITATMTVTLTLTLVGDDPTQKASQPIPASYSQYATANYLYLARYILGLILQVFWDMTMPRSPQIITLMLAEGAAAATVQASLGLASGFELGFVFRMG